MKRLKLVEIVSEDNFYEYGYLNYNKDVKDAVGKGLMTARQHFELFGKKENRLQAAENSDQLNALKAEKHEKIRSFMREDMHFDETPHMYDYLVSDLKEEFNIVEYDLVSSHEYDRYGKDLIEKYKDGILLDCGAGNRPIYYTNVVNFEIVAYPSTDVRGVGEVLPFKDNSFDAIISIAVLEHVKDPFKCASEMARVLKPGGEIVCSVPFLQPYHGYPHHYYNMTRNGIRNLFEAHLEVDNVIVPKSLEPIWALNWFLNSWAKGLSEEARNELLDLRVRDLTVPIEELLEKEYVTELNENVKSEIAAGHTLLAHKAQ